MSKPDSSPDEALVALLRADHDAPAPGGARARVAERMGAAFGPTWSGHRGKATPPAGGSGGLTTTTLGVKGALVVAFAVGGVGGAALHASLAQPAAPTIVYVDRPAPIAVTATTTPTTSAPPASMASTTSDSPLPTSPPRSSSPRPATAYTSPTSQLDAERGLLDTARRELAGGDAVGALGALDRHADLFPHPMLAEEREALTIEALVRAARYDEARKRATSFRAQSPNSLFQPAIDATLATIP